MVTSLDGRSTQKGNGNNIHSWTSKEDQNHFSKVVENAKLIIMGSTTYETVRNNMQHKEGKLRIVITHDPSQYENEKITGKLEFTDETPSKLITRLENMGYKEGYLVGGAHTNTAFFKEGLITELWQTVEPKILGLGNGIIGEEEIEIPFQLISLEKMNPKGTLLLKYRVAQK